MDRSPNKAVDGDASTFWCSRENATIGWWMADLGTAYIVHEVHVDWHLEARSYRVEKSFDGETFHKVHAASGVHKE